MVFNAFNVFTIIWMDLILFGSGVYSVKIVSQNHESVQVVEGEAVNLLCTANSIVRGCNFRSPAGKTFNMYEGANYGRVTKYVQSERDCGIEISDVEDSDNGQWECSIAASDENGASATVQTFIAVVVAVPPQDVTLKIGDVQGMQEYKVRMDKHLKGEAVDVACIATGARPAPSFVWSIGDTVPINGDVVDSAETLIKDGKRTFVQTLKFYPKPAHNEQELKCTVQHPGYRPDQLEARENEAAVKLDILYPPQKVPKEKSFYDLKEGQANTIRMKFYANPKPTEGIWKLGGQELAVGAESIDQKYKSSVMEEGDVDGQWVVALTINNLSKEDGEKASYLHITNDEGTAEYSFKLALGAKPPPGGGVSPIFVANGESNSGLAIGVIVVIALIVLLLILVVVARSKGMLCFAAKGGDDHDEEKEAFENVEKGEAAPIVQDSKKAAGGGDAKSTSPEKNKIVSSSMDDRKKGETEAEDKNSNGAHTPV